MSSAEEPGERAQALRAIDEQLDALGGDEARGRSLVNRWIGDADREALLADLEANAPSVPSESRRAVAAPVARAPVAVDDVTRTSVSEPATAASIDAREPAMDVSEPATSAPSSTKSEPAEARWSDEDRSPETTDAADDAGDTPMFGVPAIGAGPPVAHSEPPSSSALESSGSEPSPPPDPPAAEEPSMRQPTLAVAPPPMLDSIPPGHVAAPIEPAPPVGVAVEPTDARNQRPSRGPASRRKSALPPPVRRSEAPASMPPTDGRIAVPAELPRSSRPPARTSEAPAARHSSPPRASEAPARSERPQGSRLSSIPPLDDGGLSLDLGEIGPAEGTRISQVDLPAETTHAHAMMASMEPTAERGSVLPPRPRPSDRPIMGSDPFATGDSVPGQVAPTPLADLFADADDVLFGPDASRPLSAAAPPPTAPPSDPARGSLEVDLEDLDSEIDSFIEDAPQSRPPTPPRGGRPRFTASDTVMAKPFAEQTDGLFDADEATTIGTLGMLDEVEPTMVGNVEQFEELGLGLSAEDPQGPAQGGGPSQPPLGGLRGTNAPPPPDAPRSKGFLKKLFGGK